MPCSATSSSGRYAVESVTTAALASVPTGLSSYQLGADPDRDRPLQCAPMAKPLATGGSGFLGSHLVRALAERGDDLRLLVRRSSKVGHIDELEFERVNGVVTDKRAVRRAMQGVDR